MKLPANFEMERYGLRVRFVNEDDAEFIVRLRTHPKLSRFIHRTDNDIEKQKNWIKAYKKRESAGNDYYFLISISEMPCSLLRIYDIEPDSFSVGSWVSDPSAPFECAPLSMLIVHSIGFDILGKNICLTKDGTHVNNFKVNRFVKMLGKTIVGKRMDPVLGEYNLYTLEREVFEKNRIKLERLLLQTNNI
jgi:hypothetical protein